MKHLYTSLAFVAMLFSTSAFAQSTVQMELRPHCSDLDSSFDSALDAPAVGFMLDLNNDSCTRFSSKDPSTLQLQGLEAGETFEIDIIITNADEEEVTAAAANVRYDPENIALSNIQIDTEFFAESAPGGKVIDATVGTMNIVANSSLNNSSNDSLIRIATFTVEVLDGGSGVSTIEFSEVDTDETGIFTIQSDTLTNILTVKPASLELARTNAQAAAESSSEQSSSESVSSSEESSSSEASSESMSSSEESSSEESSSSETMSQQSSSSSSLKNIGDACTENNECLSENCNDGVCGTAGTSIPNGGSCIVDFQCASFYCDAGVCMERTEAASSSSQSSQIQTPANSNVAFSLLQVQNLRLTSDDTNVYLAWDKLNSSQVQGYTMYYGTVRSQYIQRKTVPQSETSLVIRDLPKGVQYFFSLKAVNSAGDETAFSPEVSVVIGDPQSSTSPLAANISGITTTESETVLGETGLSSSVALAVLGLAISGTLLFVRRRSIIATQS